MGDIIIEAVYRAARPGELPPDRIVDIVPNADGTVIHVVIAPGHASAELLKQITEEQRSAMETGRWKRLENTAENRIHPRRVFDACWELAPAHRVPIGIHCLSVETVGRHAWLIREGEATPHLVAELSLLLRRMVRSEVWILGDADESDPDAHGDA